MPPIIYNSILWNNGSFEVSPGCDGGAMVYYSDVMGGASSAVGWTPARQTR